jgi:hypothetical protein
MSKGIRNNDRLMIFDENLAENLFEKAKEFSSGKSGNI